MITQAPATVTMRAAAITAPRRCAVNEVPMHTPGPGHVRVRLRGCGVCASSLPLWQGRPWFNYPLEPGSPGHEGWGVVDEVADDVEHVCVGDRVAVLSYHAFADHDIAPAECVVQLPHELEGVPFPGEALGCAMNVLRRCAVEPGQNVAIVGVGFLGALLLQLCANAGARVIAISRRSSALRTAASLCHTGECIECIPLEDSGEVIRQVNELTGSIGCERVIEATGHQEPLDLAAEITATRGRLIIAGYHQDGTRTVNMQQWNWRGIDVINAHERDEQTYIRGMREAAQAVACGTLDPSGLYTHTFSLDELPAAMDALEQRPEGFMKALIEIDGE